MKLNLDFPIELGQEFRRKTIENFKRILENYQIINKDIEYHRKKEQHAHNAKQIDYKLSNVHDELTYQDGRIEGLVIGHNGDGVEEVKDSRTALDGTNHEILSKRLKHDLENINNTIENNYNKLNSKIERIRNVNDFGADPTGQKDSTEAFKQAFGNGGQHIHMTEGLYIVDGLELPSNTILSGEGKDVTILKLSDTSQRHKTVVTNKDLDGTAHNIYLKDFTTDNNKNRFKGETNTSGGITYPYPTPYEKRYVSGGSLASGIRFAGVTNGQAENIKSIDAMLHGFDITYASDSYSDAGDGVRVREDLESKFVRINNCESIGFGDDGITTHHSRYLTITNNISHHPKNYHGNSNGIEVDDGSQYVFLEGNYTYRNHVGLEIKAHATTSAPNGVFVNSHHSNEDTRSYVLRHIGHHRAATDSKTKTASNVVLNNCVAMNPTRTDVYPGWTTRALTISAYRNVSVNNFTAISNGTADAGNPAIVVQFMAENIQLNNINVSGFKSASADIKVIGGVNRPKKITMSNINIRNSSNNIGIAGGAKVYDIKILGANLIGNGQGNAIEMYNRAQHIVGVTAEGYTNGAKIIDKLYKVPPTFTRGGFVGGSTGSGAMSNRSAVIASSGNTFAHSDRSWAIGSGAENTVKGSRTGIVNSLRSETDPDGVAQVVMNSHRVKSPGSHTLSGGWSASGKASVANVKYSLNSYNGNIKSVGTIQAGQNFGDYAEYFESQSGQEIPNGYLVTLDGRHIRKANSNDKPIGVISGTAGIVLGDQMFHHKDRYLKDEFGVVLTEEIETEIVKDDGEIIKVIKDVPIINDEWKEQDEEYQSRAERPEWNVVGLMGQVFTRIDSTVQVNDYIKPNKGIGTKDNNNGFYRVLEITTPYDSEKGYGVAVVLIK
ncbi:MULTISPECIES: peptidase G2 autoproteolytic cleavage domain-containing protein [unclassified Staphylococcus]|uniref:peptidase G2 autoproteolytic cleavage domain-containing protein n=1 Tax=unclassified Staphylococcus TaxID=91994 RepID=UPI001950A579|nr:MULTISPECIES: peptidase G2 autoproteolytic cleavage domain-containing protein [unclassified Staphylococcus]